MTCRYETVTDARPGAPWLALVHGLTQDRRVFSAQVAAFKASHRLLLIDLPGHGLSAAVPGPYGHADLAAHVADALKQSGIGRCHYWATHTGTAVGLLIAAAAPDLFHSMVLEAAVLPGHAMPSVDLAIQRIREVARRDGVPAARQRWCEEGAWFAVMRERADECRAEAHWSIIRDFSGEPWLHEGASTPVEPVDDRLPGIDLPVLLYNGERDLPDFLAAAAFLEARLPNVRRAFIPGAGAFPGWEFPALVNPLVAQFLEATASRQA